VLTVRLTILAAVTGGVLAMPAPALASAGNAAATQAYIRANYALVHAAAANIHRSEAALTGVVAQVRSECPNAAEGSPQDHDSEQLSDEVVGAIVVAGVKPSLAAIHSFTRSAGSLHWSSHGLTSAVRAYIDKLETLSTLTPPNLCGDVKAWVASGYQTLPASTVRFDAQYTPVWVALGELPATLSRFEGPQERGLISVVNRLENQITEYEARAVERYAEILDALELKQ
jgi:hypothetical protein